MNLDLSQFTEQWQPERDAVAARRVVGLDGTELIQLRVDLGVLQMDASGRPDGARVHGHPTAVDHVRHELRLGRPISESAWSELERELHQFNYRRLAYAGLAEDALSRNAVAEAIDLLGRTVRDVEHCLTLIILLRRDSTGPHVEQIPVLIFNRARLLCRALALEEQFEEAIDTAQEGIAALEEALIQAGFDEAQRESDPGIGYLRQTARRLREQYGIDQTLKERLADAVAREDFSAAARFRDELQRRGQRTR
jgi:hypothetical protein